MCPILDRYPIKFHPAKAFAMPPTELHMLLTLLVSISPDRREVCPPWHSASQPRASRLVCMKGKLIAAAATEMNDIHDPIITPRCIGGFLACSGFVLGSAAISRVEVLPLGSSECRPNSIEVLRSMAAEARAAV